MSRIRNGTLELLWSAIAICTWASVLVPGASPQSPARNADPRTPHVQTEPDSGRALQLADEKPVHPGIASPGDDARIGPDDLLDIDVFEAPEMNRTVRVSASGEVSFELFGPVHAAGLTPRELESVLQEMLRRSYLKDPHVSVFVHEWRSHSVSVLGAVKSPGVFQIQGTKSLIEVLSLAQGLADDAGNTALIAHAAEAPDTGFPDGSSLPPPATDEINLWKLLNSPDSRLNVTIRSGDIIKVSRAGIVYVVGEVNRPGGFMLQNNENISVLQAIALAQGLTHTSAISRARIIRTDEATGKRAEIPMNLGKILAGKSTDMFLQPKDVVFVPNSAAKSAFYRGAQAAVQTAAGVAIYKW
jgi:polysaccharide biosynthesis/export protein